MAVNPDSSNAIYRWIERKPLTEAMKWTSREKFWLITAACNYGTSDWKSVAQVVTNAGEPYRPKEWYTPKNCERQFKIIISNNTKELKSMSLNDMMEHIAENLRKDYIRDSIKLKEVLKDKYCELMYIMNRLKQGSLSRQEIINLYSQAKEFENEGKQYMEQLMMRQKATLDSENSNSCVSEEPIFRNTTPTAPLLTSLLRSRNTISVNKPVTSNNSLLPSPIGTRTRSGKLLPLSSSVRITQGTPTLSKLLEAPANPYIPNSTQSIQKNNQSEIVTDKLIENTKKDNSQSTSLNMVDIVTLPGSLTKSDVIASKKQSTKSPISTVKNGSKANLNVINLLSDSENDDSGQNSIQNVQPKNLFCEKKDISSYRIETRATRSQTRAEVNFKQLNDSKVSDEKNDQETVRQHSTESQLTDVHSVADQLIDIDQTEVEPLSSGQDVMLNQTSPKITRSSVQRPRPTDNLSTTKVNTKKINNKLLEEISTNFVLNSSIKNVSTEYKNITVGQSQIDNANISGCLIPIDSSSVIKDTIIIRKDGHLDGKLFKQNNIIELKGANPMCNDSINDPKLLSFANQPIVVVNKIKTPYNMKLSDLNTDVIHVKNNDQKKTAGKNNSSSNFIQLLDGNCSLSDEVIVIDDDVNINVDTLTKTKELSSNVEIEMSPLISIDTNNSSMTSDNLKPSKHQLDPKKNNDKMIWTMFGKTEDISNVPSKKLNIQDTIPKTGNNKTKKEDINSRFIKDLNFDFDQPITETSLAEFYNGVEELVQMHSFDNEELNSLMECSTSLGNGSEVHKDSGSLDQGDSSVSESDSTIGAFDTFAQITRVPQKSSSNGIKSASKDSMVIKQGVKDLARDKIFIQSNEIDDEQTSKVSVTGIPILQGVISDVMSKIDSDRVATLNEDARETHIDDIVEISSDEDVEIVDNDDKHANGCRNKDYELKKLKEANRKEKIKRINYQNAQVALNIIKEIEKTYNKKYEQKKSNIIHVRGGYTIRQSTTTMNTQKMENILSEKKMKLMVHKGAGTELKNVKDNNQDKLLQINKMVIENKFKENEMKNAKGIELKTIAEEKSCEIASKNVGNTNERLLRETEEREKNEGEETRIQEMKPKEVERNEFAVQIMKRLKETTDIEKELKKIGIKKAKESEIKKIKEAEMKETIEAKVQKIKEDEILKRAKEEDEIIKTRKTQELEIQKAIDAETQQAKEIELQRVKEAEIQTFKETEIQRAKEKETRIKKEAEAKKFREAELIKAKENEMRKLKKIEIMKAEDELRKIKEIEQQNALDAKMKEKEKIIKIKEAELKIIKDVEIKEAEETRKNTTEMEVSINTKSNLLLNNIVIPKDDLISSKKFKKTVNERSILETKKANFKEVGNNEFEVEGSKSKEQEIKKVSDNEKKIDKDEIKICTRTRGLKSEEKCKDLNIVSNNALSDNSDTSIKSLEQLPSNMSLTNVEILAFSNHDSKKQSKCLDSVNKRKTSDSNSKVVYDNITGDLSESSSESIKKDNSQFVRTRSSSAAIQCCQQVEVKITPYCSGEHNIGAASKTTLESKTRTSTNSNSPRNSETLITESPAKALVDSKCDKQLSVSVVKLDENEVTVQKEKCDQHSDSNSVKHLDNKTENNEDIVSSKTINVNKNPFTLNLRKCVRKRGINTQNDQTRQSKSDDSTLQSDSTTSMDKLSTIEVELPVKRTRRSKNNPEEKWNFKIKKP